jgi:hypothetical protein
MKTVGMYPLAVGGSHGGEADLALRHGEAGNEILSTSTSLRDRANTPRSPGSGRPPGGRMSAGSSEVDTTTTERARPAAPRTCDFHHQPAYRNDASVNLDVEVDDFFGQSLPHGLVVGTARSARGATTRQSRP